MVAPVRGDIWCVNLSPTVGREQAGRRPALVISATTFNRGPRGLVIILPLTRIRRRYPFHIELQPGESGLNEDSYIMCEQVRAVSINRLLDEQPVGQVPDDVMTRVESILRTLLDFST